MVEMFKNGLKRARRCCFGCLPPPGPMPEHPACFSACAAGLRIPRIVPTYVDVDAMFEPILEDTKDLMEYSAKRATELELELAKVDYELVCTATSSQGVAVGSQGCFRQTSSASLCTCCFQANLKRLTMMEEWELNPDIAAEVDKEISEGKWF